MKERIKENWRVFATRADTLIIRTVAGRTGIKILPINDIK
jgi:hypothetical protein